MPVRIQALPRDRRGYPIPFFVQRVAGQEPDFRVMSPNALSAAHRQQVCWVCGGRLGRFRAFVGGPLVAAQGMSAEPPSHTDCAEFSAQVCPFLSLPQAKRRNANLSEHAPLSDNQAEQNPGVTAVCIAPGYDLVPVGNNVLFRMRQPYEVRWFSEGKPACRDDVLAAMDIAQVNYLSKDSSAAAEQKFAVLAARMKELAPKI